MGTDWFAILGLAPGRYDSAELSRHFMAQRARLMAELRVPGSHAAACRRLDELHWAYAGLCQALRRATPLDSPIHAAPARSPADASAYLTRMIAAGLEDGLLRYSRRKEVVATALRLGLSEFHAQLLIAQVQFGDHRIPVPALPGTRNEHSSSRTLAGVAAVGVLAAAIFLAMLYYLGI